jgi:hypothetical protein
MSVVAAESLWFQIFVRSVALFNGVLFIIGAFIRETRPDPSARKDSRDKPLNVPQRIIAFVLGVALLLVAFGVMK